MPMRLGAALVLLVEQDLDLALADQRMVELADLIALRQIGVEIILAVEAAPAVDLRVERHAGAHRLADALAVGHRQHARHRRVDQADLRVRLGAERGRRAGEQLGRGRGDLRVDLEADHDLPLAGFALDAIRCGCVSHYHHFSGRRGEARALLDREAGVEHALLVELVADQVQAERQALPVEPAGDATSPAGRRGSPGPRTRRSDTSPADRSSSRRARTRPTARSGSGSGRTARTPCAKSCLISVRTFCALVK